MSRHVSRKQIEQNSAIGTLMVVRIRNMIYVFIYMYDLEGKDKYVDPHLKSLHVQLLVPGLQLPKEIQPSHPLNLLMVMIVMIRVVMMMKRFEPGDHEAQQQ